MLLLLVGGDDNGDDNYTDDDDGCDASDNSDDDSWADAAPAADDDDTKENTNAKYKNIVNKTTITEKRKRSNGGKKTETEGQREEESFNLLQRHLSMYKRQKALFNPKSITKWSNVYMTLTKGEQASSVYLFPLVYYISFVSQCKYCFDLNSFYCKKPNLYQNTVLCDRFKGMWE